MNKSSNLKLLVWNDDKSQAAHWKRIADAEGYPNTTAVSMTDLNEFIKAFLAMEPDVVVTDIVHNDSPLGLDLTEAIRAVDNLVPIIAVTVKPDLVFKEGFHLEDYGFCGIYPSVVFQEGGLFGTTLRQGLNIWHAQVPEFALAKGCLHALRQALPERTDYEQVALIADALRKLPSSGSINSWHAQICKDVAAVIKKRGYTHLAASFNKLVSLFHLADPFYMAGSRSRRHLSHNVQVFFLGAIVLLADTDLRQHAITALRGAGSTSSVSAMIDALLVWACVSLTHDAAYLSQSMQAVFTELTAVAKVFAPVVGVHVTDSNLDHKILSEWPESHHAEVASEFWRQDTARATALEAFLAKQIAGGIARHDSTHAASRSMGKASISEWVKFLAVLCDELQDWQRLADTLPPGPAMPWRNFSVESVRIGRDALENEFFLGLDFVAQDHPRVVKERVGTEGTDGVQSRFRQILSVLEQNLSCDKPWRITLTADFVSRSVPNVVERGTLST